MFKMREDNQFFEIAKDELFELENAASSSCALLEIAEDYCDYNVESAKIYPLKLLIKQIKVENKIITDKF